MGCNRRDFLLSAGQASIGVATWAIAGEAGAATNEAGHVPRWAMVVDVSPWTQATILGPVRAMAAAIAAEHRDGPRVSQAIDAVSQDRGAV